MKIYILLLSMIFSVALTACGGGSENDVTLPTRVVIASTITPNPTLEPTKTVEETEEVTVVVEEATAISTEILTSTPTATSENTLPFPLETAESTAELTFSIEDQQQTSTDNIIPDIAAITDFSSLIVGEIVKVQGEIAPETNMMTDANGITLEIILPPGSAEAYQGQLVTVIGKVSSTSSNQLAIVPNAISSSVTTQNPFELTASAPQLALPGIQLIQDYSTLPQDEVIIIQGEMIVTTNDSDEPVALMADTNGVTIEIVLPPGSEAAYEGQQVIIMGHVISGEQGMSKLTPLSIELANQQSLAVEAFMIDAEATPELFIDPNVADLPGITKTLPFIIDPDQSGLEVYDMLLTKLDDPDALIWTGLEGMQGEQWILEFHHEEQLIIYIISSTGAVMRAEQTAIPLPVYPIERSEIMVDSPQALESLMRELPVSPTGVRLYALDENRIEWAILNGQSTITTVDATRTE